MSKKKQKKKEEPDTWGADFDREKKKQDKKQPANDLIYSGDDTQTQNVNKLGDWEPIIPLPNTLKPVEPFSYELLPESLRPWAEDITKRMQCPPDYVAVSIMVLLATIIGKKIGIQPKQKDSGFQVIPNLWGVLIGRPSEMKTPAMSEALTPLNTLEAEEGERHKEILKEYNANKAMADIKADDAKSKARASVKKGNDAEAQTLLMDAQESMPESPNRKRYIVNDATIEKLGELLNENANGLLLQRDELAGWLNTLQREDRANDRAFYLEAFNGSGRYTYDRIGRGTIEIKSVCVSVIGTIQPGKISPYIRKAVSQGSGDDGFIQRFQLAVYPDPVKGWEYKDEFPDTRAKDEAYNVIKRLAKMEPREPASEYDDIYFTNFDDEAQALFIEWWTDLERKVRADDIHPAMEAHLAKYRSLCPSLALIIQLAEGEVSAVTKASFIKAAAWCDYLESHAERIYSLALDADAENAKTILKKIKAGKLIDGFGTRHIRMAGWAGLSDIDEIKAALNLLCEHNYLEEKEAKNLGGGRPSVQYLINPKFM